ncbi:MAG: TerD family protein, partial [Shewanella sp.]
MTSISLAKHQTISLAKQSSSALTKLEFGLGWDPVKAKTGFFGKMFGGGGNDSIDLDASVVLLDAR